MEMRELGGALWRQRLLVLLVTVLVGAAVAAGVAVAPKTYTARAEVAAAAAGGSTVEDLDALRGTLAENATSTEIVTEVQAQLDVQRTSDELRRAIDARWVEGTVLIEVEVDDRDPQVAADIANLVSAALPLNDPSEGAFRFSPSDPARAPVTFSSPNLLLAVGVGALLALVLAASAALVRDRRTYTVSSAATVEEIIDLPVLAHIQPPREPGLLAMYAGTPDADVFRRLRVSMEVEASGDPAGMVVVTGVTDGDLNAWLAANLAISLAGVGRRTLLVDARMGAGANRPTQLEPQTAGLYEVLRGAPLSSALNAGPVEGLEVVSSGRWGAESHGRLLETSFAGAAQEMREQFDVVVVIANSITMNDDAAIMGSQGAVLLAVTEGELRPPELTKVHYRLVASGSRLLGAVLVGRSKDKWAA